MYYLHASLENSEKASMFSDKIISTPLFLRQAFHGITAFYLASPFLISFWVVYIILLLVNFMNLLNIYLCESVLWYTLGLFTTILVLMLQQYYHHYHHHHHHHTLQALSAIIYG